MHPIVCDKDSILIDLIPLFIQRIEHWKGIAIENIFYQDYLDGSPIEETLLILIFINLYLFLINDLQLFNYLSQSLRYITITILFYLV